jgi:hypothetical protein
MADSILRAACKQQRRVTANDERGGGTPSAPIKQRVDGPFAALKHHPLYRAPRHGAQRP